MENLIDNDEATLYKDTISNLDVVFIISLN